MPSLGSYGPVRYPQWTRTRWYIGHRVRTTENGTRLPDDRVIFPCRYNPTEETHGQEFGYVTGPFRTKREALDNAAY